MLRGTWIWIPAANRDKSDALKDSVEGREELCGQQTRSLSKQKRQALTFLPNCILFLSLHTWPGNFAMAQRVRVRQWCPALGWAWRQPEPCHPHSEANAITCASSGSSGSPHPNSFILRGWIFGNSRLQPCRGLWESPGTLGCFLALIFRVGLHFSKEFNYGANKNL